MGNSIIKTLFFTLGYVTIMIFGYMAGLISLPKKDVIAAVKKSTVSIENAVGNPLPLVDFEQKKVKPKIKVSYAEEINPFSGGKIINFPKNNGEARRHLKSDPRVTLIPQEEIDELSDYDTSNNEVEIQISGEPSRPLSQFDNPNMINELSLFDKSKNSKKEARQPQKNNNDELPENGLSPAPDKRYIQSSPYGILPFTPKNSQPLWEVYSNPTRIKSNKKPIAYVIGGLGTDFELSIEAIKTLPSEVTLGFIPYVDNLQYLVNLARQYGHETILEIPMESYDFPRPDAGLLALKISDDKKIQTQKLNTLLSRAVGYSGVMNYLGSKYLSNDKKALELLKKFKKRGLYFLENKTVRSGIMSELAYFNNIPYGASFSTIDEILSPSMMNVNFNIIEKNALEKTPIIGTAYLSRVTLTSFRQRLKTYQANKNSDIQLIPISAYIASSYNEN